MPPGRFEWVILERKKIVIINNEKKKTATKCGIGVTPLIDSHPLETSKSYQKKKKIQVRSFRICKPYLLYNIGNSSY